MAPIIVKFEDKYSTSATPEISKDDKKMLKSGKPLTLAEMKKRKEKALNQQLKESSSNESKDDVENDLKLKRLLDESHILKHVGRDHFSGAQLSLDTVDQPIGKARVRTLDQRIRNLSETNGDQKILNKLEKIPMKRRQMLIAREREKQEKFEKDAKDAGIVLSRKSKGQIRYIDDSSSIAKENLFGKGKLQSKKTSSRGLKIHSVGKKVDGGLFFSKSQIEKINGVDSRGGRGGRGGSRGGRGGRGERGGRGGHRR